MRILFITTYFEPDSGAAAVRLSRLARLLAARGHNVTVLTTMPHYPVGQIREGYRGKFTITEESDGVKIVRAWLWATPSTRISRRSISQISFMLTAFLRGLFVSRPDVIFIEAQPVFTGLAGRLLSLIKRRPYVLNVSDLWPDHLLTVGAMTESHPIYRVLRWLVDGTYRGAACIVAMSPLWALKIRGYIGDATPIEVLYNGVDLARFAPGRDASAFKAKYDLPPDKKIVSFIGAFTTQNDFDVMLDAMAHLHYHDDVLCILVGGGTQSDAVREKFESLALSNVRWLGWVDFDDIPDAWAASDVTILALRDEPLYSGTMPAKFFEAMASGVPIVAAVKGVPADILTESGAGFVTTMGDGAALAEAVTRLLTDETLYKQCSAAGRAYASQHYDAAKVAEAYENILMTAAL